jgi:hypothetical protein
MKKQMTTLGLATLFLLAACGKTPVGTTPVPGDHPTVDKSVVLVQNDTTESGVVLPAGSTLTMYASDPHTIHVTLPDSLRFYGTTVEEENVTTGSIDITCTCNSGSGCNPYFTAKSTGCATFGNCSSCTQTISKSSTAKTSFAEGAVVDLRQGIHFITRNAEMQATLPATTAMLSDSVVVRSLANFVRPYQRDHLIQARARVTPANLPAGYRLIPVSIYGRSVLVPVQVNITPAFSTTDIHPRPVTGTSLEEEQDQVDESAGVTGYSCSCGAGTGCTKASMWIFIGMVYYCHAGDCTSCTLHIQTND